MSSAELYCKGTRVWLPHKSQVWCPGVVMSPFHAGKLVVEEEEEGESRELVVTSPADLPPLRNPDILVGANDLTTLSYLHESAVLHNLQVRFLQSNTIYTYCGIVLVAINPYQQLPIYSSDFIDAYSGHQMGEMDPHIFAVAEEAYRRMAREGCNQSIIVSGESGAGKTVSAKYTMRYFATVGGASAETQIERKVLASNPIMEAIGNAKTTRNDNSSRFGKYIEIGFDSRHRITGAHMSTYLLEKSRVAFQCEEERNYHLFYQLCASRHLPELSKLCLDPAEDFHYINQGGCVQIEDVDDQSDFSAVREALGMLGFQDNQQQRMFQVLAAILHLGNVEIGSDSQLDDDESQIDPADPHLLTASSLLGVDGGQLRQWLVKRRIVTAQETLTTPLTPAQATNARDGLAKQLYSSLFQWVVGGINRALRSDSAQHLFIGVLDIYGFEVFQTNGFEQFCINYANEKLQQQFNMHVFKLEQQEYIKEAIEWSFIDFYDNQPCIDLVESRLGVLDLLDETCRLPKGCDQMFIQKLYQGYEGKGSAHFSKPRTSTSAFAIRHYAGCVEYEGCGFVGKNVDSVIEEHMTLLRASKSDLVSQLFQAGHKKSTKTSNKQRGKKGSGVITRPTVGSQFRESLADLMKTLNSTTPHYIRCIKPNDEKLPFLFDPQRAVQQLRACGVLETIRISAAGYPSRWLYRDFFDRYVMLLPSSQVRREDVRQMCEYILQRNIEDKDKYRFGKTKIFFRAGQVAFLERLRSQRLHDCGVLLQRHIRGWLERRRYQRLRHVTLRLQARTRGLLARRRATFLRRTRAAVLLQRNVRCLVHRRRYLKLRLAATTLQAAFRGKAARARFTWLLRDSKARLIQRLVRGWLARRAYRKALRDIVTVQCCARKWLARRELRKLKIEARSVDHVKKLNKGLEIKVIQLQQKLSDQLSRTAQLESQLVGAASASEECRCALQATRVRAEEAEGLLAAERGRSSTLEEELNAIRGRSSTLEEELNALREQREKEAAEHRCQVEQLQQQLAEARAAAQSPRLRDPESPINTRPDSGSETGAEWQEVGLELTHLREHHQKSLSEFRALEQHCAQLQKELQSLKHRSPDATSLTLISELFSSSILSPPYSRPQSQTQMSGSGILHHSSSLPHLHLFSSTPGTNLGTGLDGMGTGLEGTGSGPSYLSPDSSETPTTLTSEKETLVFSEMKQKILELEQERDSVRRVKEALEEKMENSGVMSGEQHRRELQALERAKASLTQEVAGLKHALQQTCSTSSLNVSLQQEVARLTEENLNLLESLEYFQHESKTRGGVARTPMSPRRRINPCGAASPKKKPVKFRGFDHLQEVAKPALGLLSWKPEDLSKVLKSLILEIGPENVHGGVPCLPAHMIFMCLCYPAHQNNEPQLVQFVGGVVSTLQQVTENHHGNLELLAFWLANVCRLMHNIRQYSEQQLPEIQTSHSSLANFNLTEYREMLADRAMSLYQEIVTVVHGRLQPLIVPGLMEHEAIQGISGSRPIGSRRIGSHDVTVETVVKELSSILATLHKSCLCPEILEHIIEQEYHMIAACMLNNLLLRRDMCHWSRGMQIRYNLSRLEEWCRDNEVCGSGCSEGGGALEQLQPIVQASKLLQMRKSRESDAEAISELCTRLNPLQVQKILTMYSPANGFEERVPVSVIRQAAKRSGADQADPSRLMADVNHMFPVSLPYTPSAVNFTTLSFPSALRLNFLVRI